MYVYGWQKLLACDNTHAASYVSNQKFIVVAMSIIYVQNNIWVNNIRKKVKIQENQTRKLNNKINNVIILQLLC